MLPTIKGPTVYGLQICRAEGPYLGFVRTRNATTDTRIMHKTVTSLQKKIFSRKKCTSKYGHVRMREISVVVYLLLSQIKI